MSPPEPRRRPGVLAAAAVVAGVALLAALLGFGLTRDPREVRSALLGRAAPAFTLPRLDGTGELALEELRGQVVVVNFWASWCAECKVEHPALVAAWQRYRDRGVVLVGIPFQDARSDALAYLREAGGGWPSLWDGRGETALAFGVFGVPETYFIGRDGRVAHRHVGPVSFDVLTSQITALLGDDA